MLFKIGDLVTRKSYDNDILFKIINIIEDTAYLKGIDIRLIADSNIDDLEKYDCKSNFNDEEISNLISEEINLERSEYFYYLVRLPLGRYGVFQR